MGSIFSFIADALGYISECISSPSIQGTPLRYLLFPVGIAATVGYCVCAALASFFQKFTCVIESVQEVALTVWDKLQMIVYPLSGYFKGTIKIIKQIIKTIKHYIVTRSAPLPIRFVIGVIRWIMGIITEFLIFFFYDTFKYWLIWGLFLLLWVFVGYPYLMYMEERPWRSNDGIALYVNAFKGLYNFFAGFVNFFADAINPVLPIEWAIVNGFYKVGSTIYSFILSVIGINTSFDIGGASFENFGSDLSSGRRRQLAQDILSEQANTFFAGVGTGARYVWNSVTLVICIAIDIYYDFAVILLEIFLKIIESTGIGLIKFIINLVVNFACVQSNFRCFMLHIVNGVVGSLFGSECIASDYDVNSTPCICSGADGGPFVNLPPCRPVTYSCIETTTDTGAKSWAEYRGDGSLVGSSPDRNTGCAHSVSASGRRLLLPAKSSFEKCNFSCISIKGDSWMFEVCGKHREYRGRCDSNPLAHKDKPIYNQLDAPTRIRHLKEYHKYFPDDKTINEQGEEDSLYDVYSSVSMKNFVNLIKEYETCSIDDKQISMECSKASYSLKDLTFEELLFSITCIGKKAFYYNGGVSFFGGDPNAYLKGPTTIPQSSITTYIKPFREDEEGTIESPIKRLTTFHSKLVNAHKEYMGPDYKGFDDVRPKGEYLSIVAHAATSHWNGINEKYIEENKRRRQLLPEDIGEGTQSCDNNGLKMCPSGNPPCVTDLTLCKGTNEVTLGYVLLQPAYYLTVGLPAIDFASFFVGTIDCYDRLSKNSDINPASVKNVIKANANAIQYGYQAPTGVIFCPFMIPYIPRVPIITWEWSVFVKEVCGTVFDASTSSVQQCSCPQFYIGTPITSDYTSRWVPGLPFAVYPRLFNSYKWIQILITPLVPTFISALWTTIIISVFCQWVSSPTCEEVTNVFIHEYAIAGLSPFSVNFCLFLSMGSVLFSFCFIYYPFTIVLFFGQKLLWRIIGPPIGCILWIIYSWFNFISAINYNYTIVERSYKRKINDLSSVSNKDIESNDTSSSLSLAHKLNALKLSLGNAYDQYDSIKIEDMVDNKLKIIDELLIHKKDK